MKNLSGASKLNAVAAVLGIVGLIATIVNSTMNADNALLALPTCIVLGLVGIALCVVSIVMSKNELVAPVCVLGAIACFMYVLYAQVIERILMIAGLFSYAAGNTAGWQVFYVMIVACVALLLSCIVLMVGSFSKAKN